MRGVFVSFNRPTGCVCEWTRSRACFDANYIKKRLVAKWCSVFLRVKTCAMLAHVRPGRCAKFWQPRANSRGMIGCGRNDRVRGAGSDAGGTIDNRFITVQHLTQMHQLRRKNKLTELSSASSSTSASLQMQPDEVDSSSGMQEHACRNMHAGACMPKQHAGTRSCPSLWPSGIDSRLG